MCPHRRAGLALDRRDDHGAAANHGGIESSVLRRILATAALRGELGECAGRPEPIVQLLPLTVASTVTFSRLVAERAELIVDAPAVPVVGDVGDEVGLDELRSHLSFGGDGELASPHGLRSPRLF